MEFSIFLVSYCDRLTDAVKWHAAEIVLVEMETECQRTTVKRFGLTGGGGVQGRAKVVNEIRAEVWQESCGRRRKDTVQWEATKRR